MTILVVKSCDGDFYYSAGRNRAVNAALNAAATQVLNQQADLYDDDDREFVRVAHGSGDAKRLKAKLLDIGAIREARVED